MDGLNDIDTDALVNAARNMGFRSRAPRGNGVGDFVDPFLDSTRPATSMPQPPGPADFPVVPAPADQTTLMQILDLLKRILAELIKQNIASDPVTRARSVNVSDSGTLDWSQRGTMDRLMIRNKGPNSVWFAFDMNGPAVDAFTSDLSFELQPQESVNLSHCKFEKIGLKCGSAGGAVVHAIGFQSVAGDQAASIS